MTLSWRVLRSPLIQSDTEHGTLTQVAFSLNRAKAEMWFQRKMFGQLRTAGQPDRAEPVPIALPWRRFCGFVVPGCSISDPSSQPFDVTMTRQRCTCSALKFCTAIVGLILSQLALNGLVAVVGLLVALSGTTSSSAHDAVIGFRAVLDVIMVLLLLVLVLMFARFRAEWRTRITPIALSGCISWIGFTTVVAPIVGAFVPMAIVRLFRILQMTVLLVLAYLCVVFVKLRRDLAAEPSTRMYAMLGTPSHEMVATREMQLQGDARGVKPLGPA